jgi:hypothetical protein
MGLMFNIDPNNFSSKKKSQNNHYSNENWLFHQVGREHFQISNISTLSLLILFCGASIPPLRVNDHLITKGSLLNENIMPL